MSARRGESSPRRWRLPRLAALCVTASLAPHPAPAAERPLVILFGGYGATEADMRLWAGLAAKDPVYGRAFDFEGIAYPRGANGNVNRAVRAATGTIDAVVRRVRAMAGRRVVVAGHSSGAALAVSVVTQTGTADTIKLISLDAGINAERAPPPGYNPIGPFECWSAASTDAVSFGFRRAQELCREHFFVLRGEACRTPICLHYAVLNRRADPDLTFKASREVEDGISGGYRDLSVNLDWLATSQ